MKTLQHIIRRLCRRAEMRYTLAADGSVTIRQGWRRVYLSHDDYLLLAQLKGWQE
jgi:transcriptional regulator, MarR family|nr:MAG TPA: hypothetical protein [Caudoviricetes sp.]